MNGDSGGDFATTGFCLKRKRANVYLFASGQSIAPLFLMMPFSIQV
jgi:hypothetical protein